MQDDFQTLIDNYLDDDLSSEESAFLNTLIKANPEHSRRFARAMLLHDRLCAELQAQERGEERIEANVEGRTFSVPERRKWTVAGLAGIAALTVMAFIIWHGGTASAAIVAIDRMIEAASQSVDRVYRVRVIDHGPNGAPPTVLSGGRGRKPGIDNAELYIRGSDKFVLIRYFGDGTKFVTGSDGALGWAVAPKGPIHVSRDTRRFRRGVPGEHEELPFVDLKSGLNELRRSYDLQLNAGGDADPERLGWRKLDAVKSSSRRNGPEQVHIWFDTAGVAHRIELAGISQEFDGPQGVVLELIEQRNVGPEFFKHETHHAPDRHVDWE